MNWGGPSGRPFQFVAKSTIAKKGHCRRDRQQEIKLDRPRVPVVDARASEVGHTSVVEYSDSEHAGC